MPNRFTIFGAGLSGSLMAVYLARAGHEVELYERRPDPRRAGSDRGRSINLALSVRGIDALAEVGLADEVLATAIPMRGRMIHDPAGRLSYQSYSKDGKQAINSVSRSGLNLTLINAAERLPNIRIHFGTRCEHVDFETNRAEVLDAATGEKRIVQCADHIIGADGAFSGVRTSMQKREYFNYEQSYLSHGYKELTIPAAASASGGRVGGSDAASPWPIEKHALHIWPRGSYMMIALPNADGSFTCTLFWPLKGANSFEALRDESAILRFFQSRFPDAVPLIPDLTRDFKSNPVGSLVTVRCFPWSVSDRAVLIGDAAHAIVPFFGQGMNASFEDCKTLAACLAHAPTDTRAAFAEYERLRKPNADAIADLALENFIEMRDKVASPIFRAKKHAEHTLERFLPGLYLSLYEMISFSTIPYAAARSRAAKQRRAVAGILAAVGLLILLAIWLLALRRGEVHA
ncbi:MAG TPA: NAD(P)/FAD-dependent oxidoreductase [Phycisphaerales bacterium]|nr:NAD(P)/FAD-dependent oxidoreductase [Phycisphaerales bacterium]